MIGVEVGQKNRFDPVGLQGKPQARFKLASGSRTSTRSAASVLAQQAR
jgi:hypothetical protein